MKQQRNTRQKQMVLEAVRARTDHPTADSIFFDVRARDGRVSRGTVYRVLGQLSQTGEINHVKVPGADRFDLRCDPHCHLICVGCGRVIDAPAPYTAEADRALAALTGYEVYRHRTVFEGLCPACRQTRAE